MAGLQTSGLGSGLDVNGLVSQLVAAERAPTDQRLSRKAASTDTSLSALGTLRGALSTLMTSVRAFSATREQRAVSVTDQSAVRAVVGADVALGAHTIDVRALAANHRLASTAFADGASSKLGSGTLRLSQAGRDFVINVTNDTTLATLRDAINAVPDNTGMRATLLTTSDGTRLLLESTRAGSASAISVQVDGATGSLAGWPTSLATSRAARDAEVVVDGFAVVADGNRVTDAIDGVTLEVAATTGDISATLTIGEDIAARSAKVEGFVNAYNAFMATAQRLRGYDAGTRVAGPLLGDSSLRAIESGLRQTLALPSSTTKIASTQLSELGISIRADGFMVCDAARSSATLADGARAKPILFSENGLMRRLDQYLSQHSSSDGVLAQRVSALQTRKREIATQNAALDSRMALVEKRYRAQFTALDSMLSDLQNTSSYIAKQLK